MKNTNDDYFKGVSAVKIILLILFFFSAMVLIGQVKAEDESRTIFEPKYPSGVIYGFIEGCHMAFEDAQYKSNQLWPADLKDICSCMMDGLREAIPLQDFLKDWGGELTPEQNSMSEMFGMICTEQIIRRKLQQNRDPA